MKNKEIFLENKSLAYDFIQSFTYPYEVLPNIHDFIITLGASLSNEYVVVDDNVWIHTSASISDKATIIGPCIIDEEAEIHPDAYIRGNVLVGKNTRIGHACEIKNSIIFDDVKISHLNYVGDSIIGSNVHLSASSILSNTRLDKQNIFMGGIDTKLKKVGSFISENVEIGCHSIINPGTIIGSDVIIYPLVNVGGIIPSHKIVKSKKEIVDKI